MGEVKAQFVRRHQRTGLARMPAQNGVQFGVQQVRGGVVADGVPPPGSVHPRNGNFTHPRFAFHHPAHVHQNACRRPADIFHLNLPTRRSCRHNRTHIRHLTARFNIETRLGQHHFHAVAHRCRAHRFPFAHQRQDFSLNFQDGIRVVGHPILAQLAFGVQVFKHGAVNIHIVAAHRPKGLPRARSHLVIFHRLAEAGFIHVQILFAGNIARDLQRQAVGSIQFKRPRAVQNPLAARAHLIKIALQNAQAAFHRALEAHFLARQAVQNGGAVAHQLRVMLAVNGDHLFCHLRQKRLGQADFPAKACPAADDHPAHVVAPRVPRDDPIRNQERRRPRMIGDHPIRGEIRIPFGVAVARDPLNHFHQGQHQIGAVVRVHTLHNAHNALKAHARIHVHGRQRLQRRGVNAVVLNKHQIPDFQVAGAVAVHAAHMPGHTLFVAGVRPQIHVDFAARSARPGVSHFPEVILAAVIQHLIRVDPRLLAPGRGRFFVGGDIALIIFEAGRPQTRLIQAPHLGQQLPCPGDRLRFVVIAKRPVAQHFKERVVRIVTTHIVQIVVLASHAHAFLAVGSPRVRPVIRPQKHVFKLDHPGVGEQQSLISPRNQ